MAMKHTDKNGVFEMNPHLEVGDINDNIVTDNAGP